MDIFDSKIHDIVVFGMFDSRTSNGQSPWDSCHVPNFLNTPSTYNRTEKDRTALKDKHTGSVNKIGKVFMQIARRAHGLKPSGRNPRGINRMRTVIAAMNKEIGGCKSKYAVAVNCEN